MSKRRRFRNSDEALAAVTDLGEQLAAAREKADEVTRELHDAIRAAAATPAADGRPINRSELTRCSGLARQTIYNVLGEQ